MFCQIFIPSLCLVFILLQHHLLKRKSFKTCNLSSIYFFMFIYIVCDFFLYPTEEVFAESKVTEILCWCLGVLGVLALTLSCHSLQADFSKCWDIEILSFSLSHITVHLYQCCLEKLNCLDTFVRIHWPCMWGPISGVSILFFYLLCVSVRLSWLPRL